MKFAGVDISTSSKKLRIIAYGFDVLGFLLPGAAVSVGDNVDLEYLSFQANGALDSADAAIIPQGIFENIEYTRGYETYTEVRVSKSTLQQRDKQVFNLIQEGKWVCFLVASIVDKVPQVWNSQEIDDTDLGWRQFPVPGFDILILARQLRRCLAAPIARPHINRSGSSRSKR